MFEKIKSEMKESLEKKIKETKPKKHSWEKLLKDITC
ncbi:hypothetical protein LCGC14_2058660 [marine sediment metagenome]|uniref:Uncharacterized protein n=1 Tax=marine sediment metagenome TaxID=412755 RepID=A0A0F9H0B7_9ZZZZ